MYSVVTFPHTVLAVTASVFSFYRAMHFSAKRGLAIACRLSVRLSVTLVNQDHIGWKAWKQIARTIIAYTFALRSPKAIHLLPGEHGKNLGRLEVGWEKVACWSTKAAISLKRVRMEEKLLWRAYRNLLTLFRTVPFPTPYGLLFPKLGVLNPRSKLQSLLSQERVKLSTSNWREHSQGPSNKTPLKFWRKGSVGGCIDCSDFLGTPIISGMGRATDFKFGQFIRRVHPH